MKQLFPYRLTVLIFAVMVLVLPQQAVAQDAIQVIDQEWQADFRESITFTLTAESSAEIVEVDLLYRVSGQLATSRNEAEFEPGTSITAEFTIDQTDPSNYQPPGAELEYWWKIVDAAGNELSTERETLLYLDDRYDWRTLENERLSLYWYEGNDSFGQALFDRANEALNTLEQDFGVAIEDPIKIFIYGNQRDLLGAIRAGSQEWTGGQAFTTYGVVVIGVRPDQLAWGLNAMTHEISHLVIHQATDNPFSGLPRWLDEGIAVYNENRDELDQDFKPIFERAVANNELMTLRSLSSPFPADPLEANLAYGQSGAVVRFMIDTYGPDAMAELLSIFAEGALYDEALEQAIGETTDSLDNAFRASLGLPPLPGTETSGAEASGTEATGAESAEISEPAAASDEAAGSAQEEVASDEATPSDADSAPESSDSLSSEAESPPQPPEPADTPLAGLPCLAGLLALLVMAGAVYAFGR